MDNTNLIITVSGQVASGKSRVTFLLKKFLREQGFQVEFNGNADHPTEAEFDKYTSHHLDNVIDNLSKTRKITLKEVQLAHEPK